MIYDMNSFAPVIKNDFTERFCELRQFGRKRHATGIEGIGGGVDINDGMKSLKIG